MPDGLSMTSQPLMSRPLRRRAIVVLLLSRRLAVARLDILAHPLAVQQAVDPLCLVEGGVEPEIQARGVAKLHHISQAPSEEGGGPLQRRENGVAVLARERQHE